MDTNTAKALGLDKTRGVLIGAVIPGEPAEKAGIQAGDVVLAIDGKAVENSSELLRIVADQKPGTTVKLTIWRAGKEQVVRVKLGERGSKGVGANGDDDHQVTPSLGLTVRALTAEEAASAGLKTGQGLLVLRLAPGKAAAEAGLKEGDILLSANLIPLRTINDLANVVRGDAAKRGAVMLQVVRHGQTFFRTVPLEEDK